MNRVFGKKKPAVPAPTLDEASSGLGGRLEDMDKKILSLENELRGYKDKIKKSTSPAAKKALQKRAMEVLKRKRMYEQQRDVMAGQQFNIDQASFGIESAKANVQTVAAMKAASTQLKTVMKKELNVDEIDDLVDDMAEMMDEPEGLDEGDLEAELDMLEDELEQEAEAVGTDATPSYLQTTVLPNTPTELPGGKVD
eukprot:CAMPEP_0170352652 /NCGR_PEP_ID=MMETSP0116_2-20130129/77638_1 /TAXON_ID=400756 /ORGANISM="Durinskia baltica, Strain CSIRO CS-38" /LENGTH=196 /DNA_ID=CAMNT_0010606579 /DNA_START=27 /DNA_END=614 /DNA_ORIENTATION=+